MQQVAPLQVELPTMEFVADTVIAWEKKYGTLGTLPDAAMTPATQQVEAVTQDPAQVNEQNAAETERKKKEESDAAIARIKETEAKATEEEERRKTDEIEKAMARIKEDVAESKAAADEERRKRIKAEVDSVTEDAARIARILKAEADARVKAAEASAKAAADEAHASAAEAIQKAESLKKKAEEDAKEVNAYYEEKANQEEEARNERKRLAAVEAQQEQEEEKATKRARVEEGPKNQSTQSAYRPERLELSAFPLGGARRQYATVSEHADRLGNLAEYFAFHDDGVTAFEQITNVGFSCDRRPNRTDWYYFFRLKGSDEVVAKRSMVEVYRAALAKLSR